MTESWRRSAGGTASVVSRSSARHSERSSVLTATWTCSSSSNQTGFPVWFELAALERELSDLLGGRQVDVRTAGDLSPRFRDRVRAEARELYTAT